MRLERNGIRMWLPYEEGVLDPHDDITDVEVILADGRRYVPTFCTPKMLERQLTRDNPRVFSELKYSYWEQDLIIVLDLSPEGIMNAVEELVRTGLLERACRLCPPESEEEPSS